MSQEAERAAAEAGLRPGESPVPTPERFDAGLFFIGRLRTPWTRRADCPRRGDPEAGPICRAEIVEPFVPALEGLEGRGFLDLLYWMHEARRDLLRQSPRSDGRLLGTFALRSPVRPNPIALSRVRLLGVEGSALLVRGLDCLDGTPLLDVKPEACPHA